MDRRAFNKLASLTVTGMLADGVGVASSQPDALPPSDEADQHNEVFLEDEYIRVGFDATSGALVRMERKSTHWMVERRPALGVSFRMLVPLPDQRANFVLGSKQRAETVEKIADNQIRLQWADLKSEHGGILPITFTTTVTLKDGALTFDGALDNQSLFSVETIEYPYFGDVNPPTPNSRMESLHMWTGALTRSALYPRFESDGGYWGFRCPKRSINSNESLFCLIQAPQEGIYVAMHNHTQPYLLQFTFEQHPGVIDVIEDNVPRGDEIAGIPVHLEFRTCHFVFAHPHSAITLEPVVMHSYSGTWHSGLDIYKEWRMSWFATPRIPDWAKGVHSWMQLQVAGAEQDFSVPYGEIVKYGEECAQNGVGAIQLVGWNRGGQDGGGPSLDTDPGLGSWQDLYNAIAQVQAKGVKIILFGKPVFADISSEWYKEVLYKYEATDPYGDKYESPGFSYTTPTQLAGINNRRRAIMDVCSQEYRDIATREFDKIVTLGASGWLFDEVLQHNGVLYNFSADHGYTPPGYLFSGDIPLAKQFHTAANKANPEFLFAGEGPGDWLMQYYPFGYYRINPDTLHAARYIDSQTPLMAAVGGFDARNQINLVLLYRYIISYEPYDFKGHLTDFPLTLSYGKKVDALRRRYREFLWDAEFHDTLGATISADGAHRYSVYRNVKGKRGVVVANLEVTKTITAELTLPDAGSLVLATPENPNAQPTSETIQIPPRSAVVVMEE